MKYKQREEEEKRRLQRLETKLSLDQQLRIAQERKRSEHNDLYSLGKKQSESVLKALQQDPALLSQVLDRVQQQQCSTRHKPTTIF
jgi:hypothetical protein